MGVPWSAARVVLAPLWITSPLPTVRVAWLARFAVALATGMPTNPRAKDWASADPWTALGVSRPAEGSSPATRLMFW